MRPGPQRVTANTAANTKIPPRPRPSCLGTRVGFWLMVGPILVAGIGACYTALGSMTSLPKTIISAGDHADWSHTSTDTGFLQLFFEGWQTWSPIMLASLLLFSIGMVVDMARSNRDRDDATRPSGPQQSLPPTPAA